LPSGWHKRDVSTQEIGTAFFVLKEQERKDNIDLGNGYSEDKKYIDKCFEENKEDHERMEKQNHAEHAEIKKDLSAIKDIYVKDVIVLKTQVRLLGIAIILMIPAVLGLIGRAIIAWVEK